MYDMASRTPIKYEPPINMVDTVSVYWEIVVASSSIALRSETKILAISDDVPIIIISSMTMPNTIRCALPLFFWPRMKSWAPKMPNGVRPMKAIRNIASLRLATFSFGALGSWSVSGLVRVLWPRIGGGVFSIVYFLFRALQFAIRRALKPSRAASALSLLPCQALRAGSWRARA